MAETKTTEAPKASDATSTGSTTSKEVTAAKQDAATAPKEDPATGSNADEKAEGAPAKAPAETTAADAAAISSNSAPDADTAVKEDTKNSEAKTDTDTTTDTSAENPPMVMNPTQNDILMGKDLESRSHAGTKNFEQLIVQFLDPYKDFKSRNEGYRVLESIRGHITHRGGRFLEQDQATGKYSVLSTKQALNEIEAALNRGFVAREKQRMATIQGKANVAAALPKSSSTKAPEIVVPVPVVAPPKSTVAPKSTTATSATTSTESTKQVTTRATKNTTATTPAPAPAPQQQPSHSHSLRSKDSSANTSTDPGGPFEYDQNLTFCSIKEKNAARIAAYTPPPPKAGEEISRGGVEIPFPWKLHEMLEDTFHAGQEWIVSWQPHGRSFLVHKPNAFVEKIMPTYFNQSKFASFQRQLNLYGFQRLSSGKDKGAYYHPYFLRGQVDRCHRVVRHKIKGTKVRRRPEKEPDFYKHPFMPHIIPLTAQQPQEQEATSSTATRSLRASATTAETTKSSSPNSSPTSTKSTTSTTMTRRSSGTSKEPKGSTAGSSQKTSTPPKTSSGAATTRSSATSPRSHGSSKDKDKHSDRHSSKEKHSSKDKEKSSKDKHSSKDKDKSHKDKDKGTHHHHDSKKHDNNKSSSSHSSKDKHSNNSNNSTSSKESHARVSGQKRPAPSSSSSATTSTVTSTSASQQAIYDLKIQVTNLANAGAAKDKEIRRLRETLAANSKRVESLRQEGKTKDKEIHKLTEELAVRDRKLARLEMDRSKVLKGLFVKDSWDNMDTFRDNLYI